MARLQLLVLFCLLALATPIRAEVNRQVFHSVLIAHAFFATSAWALFFPLGAIMVRVITHNARKLHVYMQCFALLLFTIGWCLGAWLATKADLWVTYNGHAIIGTTIFVLALAQPVLGLLHYRFWNGPNRVYYYAWAHVWIGRILVTAGIINGGLGLQLGRNSTEGRIAYGVVAGFLWLVYVVVTVMATVRSNGDLDVRGESGVKVQGLRHLRKQGNDTSSEKMSISPPSPGEAYSAAPTAEVGKTVTGGLP